MSSKIYKSDLLYDNKNDVYQQKNLVKNFEYKKVSKELENIIIEEIEKIENKKNNNYLRRNYGIEFGRKVAI